MKKLIIFAVLALVMSSCSRKMVPNVSLEKKEDTWAPYNFQVKKVIDQYGAENAQFAIESPITISKTRDTSFLNDRGDVVDSIISESRYIPAKTLCLFVSSKDATDGSVIYKMEFKMKKTGELIYLYFTGKSTSNYGKFTISYAPGAYGTIPVAFGRDEKPTQWKASPVGQLLLYSKKSGTDSNEDNATDNKLPGR